MMITCIDLKERFGNSYRTVYEESHAAERGERARGHDPWLLTILCQHGHFYPHGGELLGASTNSRGPIAKRLAAVPCVQVVQAGSDGINVVFHVDDFDAVADLLKPRHRRRLSPERRQWLAEMGNLRREGRVPAPVKLGELVRWPRKAIEDWILAGCPPHTKADTSASETAANYNGTPLDNN